MPEDATSTDTTTDQPADPDLGDAGKRALDEERRARRDAERQAKKASAELEALRAQSMTDQEKAIAEARAQARAETLAEANSRLVRAEARSIAAGRLRNPDDVALLGDLDLFVVDGDVDVKALGKAVDQLVAARPYLAPDQKPGPLLGGGPQPPPAQSMDDWIRRQAHH